MFTGPAAAVARAQEILNFFGAKLVVDGVWGPLTTAAFNAAPKVVQAVVVDRLTASNLDVNTFLNPKPLNAGEFGKHMAKDAPSAINMKPLTWLKTPAERQIANRKYFLSEVVPVVRAEAIRRGFVNPELPLIQMNVESAGGRAVPAKNNFAGIKAFKGGTAGSAVTTQERYNGGDLVTISDRFAAFDTPQAFATYYFDLLGRKWPETASARTAADWVKALKIGEKGGYATATAAEYTPMLTRSAAETATYA